MNVRTQTGALTARWSILIVLVTAVLIGGFSVWSALRSRAESRHVQAQFECVSRYLSALQERSVILARIAAEDRQLTVRAEDNITRLITDAIKASGDRAEGQKAADRYLKTSADITTKRRELDRQRAAQPLPPTPERACT